MDKVFEWCVKCAYLSTCYDETGGPYCLDPTCGDGPVEQDTALNRLDTVCGECFATDGQHFSHCSEWIKRLLELPEKEE